MLTKGRVSVFIVSGDSIARLLEAAVQGSRVEKEDSMREMTKGRGQPFINWHDFEERGGNLFRAEDN